jgi:hypothetical protein
MAPSWNGLELGDSAREAPKAWQAEYMRCALAWRELALAEKEGSRVDASEKTSYPRNPSLRRTYAVQLLTSIGVQVNGCLSKHSFPSINVLTKILQVFKKKLWTSFSSSVVLLPFSNFDTLSLDDITPTLKLSWHSRAWIFYPSQHLNSTWQSFYQSFFGWGVWESERRLGEISKHCCRSSITSGTFFSFFEGEVFIALHWLDVMFRIIHVHFRQETKCSALSYKTQGAMGLSEDFLRWRNTRYLNFCYSSFTRCGEVGEGRLFSCPSCTWSTRCYIYWSIV